MVYQYEADLNVIFPSDIWTYNMIFKFRVKFLATFLKSMSIIEDSLHSHKYVINMIFF